jgi:hypothetical protein
MRKDLIGKLNGNNNNFLNKTLAYGFSAFSILFLGYILIASINHFMQK